MRPEYPLVSILIPCYNAAPWLRQCIQSALDQSYPNKEIIVVDDGSSDSSPEIVAEFGTAVRFRQAQHQGGNAARNLLTGLSRGEWLQYLDADDYLLPGKIASQVSAATGGNTPPDVVYSPVILEQDGSADSRRVLSIDQADETITFIQWGPLNTGGLLCRRDAVVKAGSWNVERRFCQEHDLLLRLILNGSRFILHNVAEAVYRQHGTNTVSRRDPAGVIRLRMELTDRLVTHLQSAGRWTKAHRKALFIAAMECARRLCHVDPQFATELHAKASAQGRFWVRSSPALPQAYQAALWLVGFRRTESFTGWMRNVRRA